MFIVRSFVISEAKTIELVVKPKSIPPVNVGSPLTLIVVLDVSAKTLMACPATPSPVF